MGKDQKSNNNIKTTFRDFLNEETDFSLNNDTVKSDGDIKYSLHHDVFTGLYYATLLGGEFSNTYGQGKTEKDAVSSLKLRLIQLRNKRDNLKQ